MSLLRYDITLDWLRDLSSSSSKPYEKIGLKYTMVQLHKTVQSEIINPATQNTRLPALSEYNNVLESLTELLGRTLPKPTDSKGKNTTIAFISLIDSSGTEVRLV
jgi:hypothetical protein